MKTIMVSSGYGYYSGQPYVEMEAGDFKTQMSPGDARALAMNLLSAAESAMSDQFVFTFFSENLEASVNMAGNALVTFREWRKGRDYVPGHEE